ncbi:MAG: ferredoxin-thioredoxin reductase catalytic domain-containing protein [Spirochaeta sp.]
MKKKDPQDAHRFVTSVAAKQGWAINPDPDFLQSVEKGLALNYNRYGYFLCPCRDGDGVREADRDIICPCDYNIPDQKEYGHCFCGLFLSKEFAASGKPVQPIPERRPDQEDS